MKRSGARLLHRFWVIRARQQVRRVLQSCQFCKRYAKVSYTVPEAANLPVERLSTSPAFTFIGIDFAGPLYLKYFDPQQRAHLFVHVRIVASSSP